MQSLLPIDDTTLLASLIDILAFTKFSPDILLSLSDHSILTAVNYHPKNQSRLAAEHLIAGGRAGGAGDDHTISYLDKMESSSYWRLNDRLSKAQLHNVAANGGGNIYTKTPSFQHGSSVIGISSSSIAPLVSYYLNNRIVTFLVSIGFKIIGNWLKFTESELNRSLLDTVIKILTSFTPNRDMSLYEELDISVIGQRYSAHSMRNSRNQHYYLQQQQLQHPHPQHHRLQQYNHKARNDVGACSS